MNTLSSTSCGSDRLTVNNLINSLGRVERYDATQIHCCSFAKASDIADGVDVRLTNMAGGYPFEFGGATWRDSETLYLCGEFSDSSEKHLAIQEEMHRQTSGYAAKRFIKTKYKSHMRQDFADFRIQWMLYVVWQKCKGNTEFANKLTLIPQNAVIIENTTKERCDTKEVWGCSNKALTDRRDELEKEVVARAKAENPNIKKAALERLVIKETCKVNNIGVFVGEIHLLGKRLTFA